MQINLLSAKSVSSEVQFFLVAAGGTALQSVRIIHFRREIDRMNRMNRILKEQNQNGGCGPNGAQIRKWGCKMLRHNMLRNIV